MIVRLQIGKGEVLVVEKKKCMNIFRIRFREFRYKRGFQDENIYTVFIILLYNLVTY
ncbi:hypothetical protein CSC2_07870 [Clostridium zeae]|uniref:Uncharacterized protein n=1 Tax=Clostridium zeae TaxID=2759022 RepID=A0ABQ1E6E0_9CLOT|nr:hypothetical protein CSC2_07870 [Clostridium zeae]